MRHSLFSSTLALFFLLNYALPELAQSTTNYTYENSPCKKTQYHVYEFLDRNPGFVSFAYSSWRITESGLNLYGPEYSLGPSYLVFAAHAFWTGVNWQVNSNTVQYVLVKTLGEGNEKENAADIGDFGECYICTGTCEEENFGPPKTCPL